MVSIAEDNRSKRLILRARRHTFPRRRCEKPFQLLFTPQMHGNLQKVVAITPEPGALTLLCAQRKVLATNDPRHFLDCLSRLRGTNLIYEPASLY